MLWIGHPAGVSVVAQVQRSAALLSIPVGAMGRGIWASGRQLLGADREQVRADLRSANAHALREQLGSLKGGALKAGQLLSTVDSLFPEDPDRTWSEALTSLQESSPPLPFADIEPVLLEELGVNWRRTLTDFDPTACAAASLGQVHRATCEGLPVAVKIQYPGVRDSIATDMRWLEWALRAGSVVARGLTVPPVVAELRTRLTDELDYEREGRHQQQAASAFAHDADIQIPSVVLATPRVLVTTWCDGRPLVQVARDGRESRDAVGLKYQRFLLSAPERSGLLHADPHPGNFRVLDDGRLGVLDFGAVVPMPDGMPESFGRLIRVMLARDPVEVAAGLRREGFVRPDVDLNAARLAAFLSPFSDPARSDTFSYSPQWLREKFTGGPDDPRNPDYAVAMKLTIPAEQLLTHRVWLGCVGVLCRLNATVPVASELRRWLPGFAD